MGLAPSARGGCALQQHSKDAEAAGSCQTGRSEPNVSIPPKRRRIAGSAAHRLPIACPESCATLYQAIARVRPLSAAIAGRIATVRRLRVVAPTLAH